MNLLFIEPPFFRILGEKRKYIPVGLIYLASILEKNGHRPFVYNADSDYSSSRETVLTYSEKYYLSREINQLTQRKVEIYDEIRSIINDCSPSVIGISVKSETVPIVIEIILLIKKISPDIKIILGGPHFDVDNGLNYFNNVDYIIKGEAEKNIVGIIDSLFNNTVYKIDCTPIVLDELPYLNLKYLPKVQLKNISHQDKQLLSTARGCPFRCSFCYKSIGNNAMRYLSGDNIFNNMLMIYNNYGIKKYYIVDDTFGININQLSTLVKRIKASSLPIKWSCMSHVSVLTEEKIKLMSEGGCIAIHLGVESGSEKMLKMLGKDTTIDEIKHISELIHKHKIKLNSFMLVGLPLETMNDIEQSIDLINKTCPDEVAAQVYQAYPNTILFKELDKHGLAPRINWPKFSRLSFHTHRFRGLHKDEIDYRINILLNYADNWNKACHSPI